MICRLPSGIGSIYFNKETPKVNSLVDIVKAASGLQGVKELLAANLLMLFRLLTGRQLSHARHPLANWLQQSDMLISHSNLYLTHISGRKH